MGGFRNSIVELLNLADDLKLADNEISHQELQTNADTRNLLVEARGQTEQRTQALLVTLARKFAAGPPCDQAGSNKTKNAGGSSFSENQFCKDVEGIVKILSETFSSYYSEATGVNNISACCQRLLCTCRNGISDEKLRCFDSKSVLEKFREQTMSLRNAVKSGRTIHSKNHGSYPPPDWFFFIPALADKSDTTAATDVISDIPSFDKWEAYWKNHVRRAADVLFAAQRDILAILNRMSSNSSYPLLGEQKAKSLLLKQVKVAPEWIEFVEMIEEAFYFQQRNLVLLVFWVLQQHLRGTEGFFTGPLFSLQALLGEQLDCIDLSVSPSKLSHHLVSFVRSGIVQRLVPEFSLGRMTKVLAGTATGSEAEKLRYMPRSRILAEASVQEVLDDICYCITQRCKELTEHVTYIRELCGDMIHVSDADFDQLQTMLRRAKYNFGDLEHVVADGTVVVSLKPLRQNIVKSLETKIAQVEKVSLGKVLALRQSSFEQGVPDDRWKALFYGPSSAGDNIASRLARYRDSGKAKNKYDGGLNPENYVARLIELQRQNAAVVDASSCPVLGGPDGAPLGKPARTNRNVVPADRKCLSAVKEPSELRPVADGERSGSLPLPSEKTMATIPKSFNKPQTITEAKVISVVSNVSSEKRKPLPSDPDTVAIASFPKPVAKGSDTSIAGKYPYLVEQPCAGVYLADMDLDRNPRFSASVNRLRVMRNASYDARLKQTVALQEKAVNAVVADLANELQQETLEMHLAMPFLEVRIHGVLLGHLVSIFEGDDAFQSLKQQWGKAARMTAAERDAAAVDIHSLESRLRDRADTLASTEECTLSEGKIEASKNVLRALSEKRKAEQQLAAVPLTVVSVDPPAQSPQKLSASFVEAPKAPVSGFANGTAEEKAPTVPSKRNANILHKISSSNRAPPVASAAQSDTGVKHTAPPGCKVEDEKVVPTSLGTPLRRPHTSEKKSNTPSETNQSLGVVLGRSVEPPHSSAPLKVLSPPPAAQPKSMSSPPQLTRPSSPNTGATVSLPPHAHTNHSVPPVANGSDGQRTTRCRTSAGFPLSASDNSSSAAPPNTQLRRTVCGAPLFAVSVLGSTPSTAASARLASKGEVCNVSDFPLKGVSGQTLLGMQDGGVYTPPPMPSAKVIAERKSSVPGSILPASSPRERLPSATSTEITRRDTGSVGLTTAVPSVQRSLSQQAPVQTLSLAVAGAECSPSMSSQSLPMLQSHGSSAAATPARSFGAPPSKAGPPVTPAAAIAAAPGQGPDAPKDSVAGLAKGSVGTTRSTAGGRSEHRSNNGSLPPAPRVVSVGACRSRLSLLFDRLCLPDSSKEASTLSTCRTSVASENSESGEIQQLLEQQLVLERKRQENEERLKVLTGRLAQRKQPRLSGRPRTYSENREDKYPIKASHGEACSQLGTKGTKPSLSLLSATASATGGAGRPTLNAADRYPLHATVPAIARSEACLVGTSDTSLSPTSSSRAVMQSTVKHNRCIHREPTSQPTFFATTDTSASSGDRQRGMYATMLERQAQYNERLSKGDMTSERKAEFLRGTRARGASLTSHRRSSGNANAAHYAEGEQGGTPAAVSPGVAGRPMPRVRPELPLPDVVSLSDIYVHACSTLGVRPNSSLLRSFPTSPGQLMHKLDLSVNYVGVKGFQPLLYVLEHNGSALEELCLRNNNLENTEIIELVEVLSGGAGSSVSTIDLSYNPISKAGGEALLRFAESWPMLTTMHLKGTLVPPKLMQAIASTVDGNASRG